MAQQTRAPPSFISFYSRAVCMSRSSRMPEGTNERASELLGNASKRPEDVSRAGRADRKRVAASWTDPGRGHRASLQPGPSGPVSGIVWGHPVVGRCGSSAARPQL